MHHKLYDCLGGRGKADEGAGVCYRMTSPAWPKSEGSQDAPWSPLTHTSRPPAHKQDVNFPTPSTFSSFKFHFQDATEVGEHSGLWFFTGSP